MRRKSFFSCFQSKSRSKEYENFPSETMVDGEVTLVKTSENVGYYHSYRYSSIQRLAKNRKMHGVKRVIVFCILIVVIPTILIIIPLYLRHSVFRDVTYSVAESDIIEIRDGISSIFCQQHSLKMSTNFNAFQLNSKPEISNSRKHIRLKKSMTLPDDTLEYWGFYLLKGAVVELKVCSRYDGSRILVVKGDRNLETCGLLEHNKNKVGTHFAQGHDKVQVTFETVAEVVQSREQVGDKESKKDDFLRNIKNIVDMQLNNRLKGMKHQQKNESLINKYDELENHAGEDLTDDNTELNYDDVGTEVISGLQKEATLNATIHNKKTTEKVIKKKIKEIHTTEKNDHDTNNNNNNNNNQSTLNDKKTDIINSTGSDTNKTHETGTQINTINISTEKLTKVESKEKIRHRRHHSGHRQHTKDSEANTHEKRNKIFEELYGIQRHRIRRDQIYDRRISHGGNAFNFTENDSNSISSFENSLLTCYDGQILLAQGFPPSSQCSSVRFLENGTHMVSRHEVVEDGYYYYIFYSDNDLVRNDIHAVFDIYKPTFEYSNITDSKACVNSVNCTFPLNFLTDEVVIVEVPTRDGIEHDEDDITYLISTCHPRLSIYIIFPISVLLLILSCAFL